MNNTTIESPQPASQAHFPAQTLDIAERLAYWLHFTRAIYYASFIIAICAMLSISMSLGMGPSRPALVPVLALAVLWGVLVAVIGIWLGRSAQQLKLGVLENDFEKVGSGFRTLRYYFILLGLGSGIELLSTCIGLVA